MNILRLICLALVIPGMALASGTYEKDQVPGPPGDPAAAFVNQDFNWTVKVPTTEVFHIGPLPNDWTMTQLVIKVEGGALSGDVGSQRIPDLWGLFITTNEVAVTVNEGHTNIVVFSDPTYSAGDYILYRITNNTSSNATFSFLGNWSVTTDVDVLPFQFHQPTNGQVQWLAFAIGDYVMTQLVMKSEGGSTTLNIIEQGLSDVWNVFTTNLDSVVVTTVSTNSVFADDTHNSGNYLGVEIVTTTATNIAGGIQRVRQ